MGRSTHSRAYKRNLKARAKAMEPWVVKQTQEIHDKLVKRIEEENKLPPSVKAEDKPRRSRKVKVVLVNDDEQEAMAIE